MFGLLIIGVVAFLISFARTRGFNLMSTDVLTDVVIVAVTAAFGYLVMRLALAPTHEALVAQKRFINSIAHELRTPLSIMRMNAEVTLLEENLDGHIRTLLDSNIEEIDRTSHIINNVLLMSTFLGPDKMEFVDVDLGRIVDRMLQKLAPLAEYRGIRIVVKKIDGGVVVGNAQALEHAVENIVTNAITFTPFGGKIKITIGPERRGAVDLTVEDTGIGIERKDIKSILEPFYRSETSRNRAFGGSGLGLAIVNEIVKMHHGKIYICSAPGKGTTVFVSLARSRAPHGEKKPNVGFAGAAADAAKIRQNLSYSRG